MNLERDFKLQKKNLQNIKKSQRFRIWVKKKQAEGNNEITTSKNLR